MVLKRLTITGFKSFANKTVLEFDSGMTAIVGPNGSGKSNVADAIRWAMGEQSKGKLRLKDREEVVFSGTEKRARASFAEVIMLFDNESGAFPLDVTEVEISRRLYRSGESDFRLNGRSVRFNEVSALLAESGFGRDSYAVVGQGMIDNLLISSPVERKLLFEEAAGIRGFEIKRSESLKRLSATDTNIVRLRDILNEISPRLERLQQSIKSSGSLESLSNRIRSLRQDVVDVSQSKINELELFVSEKAKSLDSTKIELRNFQTNTENEVDRLRETTKKRFSLQAEALASLGILEVERDGLTVKIAEQQQHINSLHTSLDLLKNRSKQLESVRNSANKIQLKITEMDTELENNSKAAMRTDTVLAKATLEIDQAENKLRELRSRTADGSQRQYVDSALVLVKTMAHHLATPNDAPIEQLRLLVHKTGRLLSYASKSGELDVLEELKKSQLGLEALMRKRETSLEHQANITLSRRSLELDLKFHRDELDRIQVEIKTLEEVVSNLDTSEQIDLDSKSLEIALSRFGEINIQLTIQRQDITSASSPEESNELSKKVAELERVKAKISAHQLHEAELSSQHALLKSLCEKNNERIFEWSLSARPAHGNISELEHSLAVSEATFEVESSHLSQVEAELSETSEREFQLADQLKDLEAAQSNLREVVAHLDASISERFEQNFAGIADHFNRSFARLFDGGSAGLQLVRDDSGDYGITIKVNPKGKRLSSLEILSGGERALAGVALLAAILEVNPSPFIVLDEIDAALDEANSGRLATILNELAVKSQLIVITHNRQTMEAAKVLFGVSMNDHHVSHLLSLRLEDATQLAAR